jgi:hypothetical protein
VVLALAAGSLSFAQTAIAGAPATTGDTQAALQELQSQIRELKTMVTQLQQETASSRAEIGRLRDELATEHAAASSQAVTVDEQSPAYSADNSVDARLGRLEEDQQVLEGKLDTQYQTKVESASKYRVRLSGIVLFNLFGNSGNVDNEDVPTWATPPGPQPNFTGSVGGTLRQSIIGLEAFGPDWMGAHTSAFLNFDFGGGFPAVYNGVNAGIAALRTGGVRLDWKDTSVFAGQDPLFIAPLSPTSFASLLVPPLSSAGNLWVWTPQVRIEHRFALSGDSKITLQGGFLDPVTGEPPDGFTEWYRSPTAGELSRQPAYAAHVAYSHPFYGQTFTVGAGGFYSRQNYGFDRNVNAWAGMLDANLPLGKKFALSAAAYRGAALGGLGAALGRSVTWNGPLADPATDVNPINTVGGWTQLKYRVTSRLEVNGAWGMDNPFAADIRYFGLRSQSYGPTFITGNRAAFGNVIFRPRSDLVFSAEYRRLRTFSIYDKDYEAGQLNVAMGVLF